MNRKQDNGALVLAIDFARWQFDGKIDLEKQVRELECDRDRLDWLEANMHRLNVDTARMDNDDVGFCCDLLVPSTTDMSWYEWQSYQAKTLREAIDKAREAAG